MEEQLISFETAKLAKEKGFNILTHSYYFEDREFKENSLTGTNGYYGDEYEFFLSEFNENWNDKWLTKKNGNRCFGCNKDKGYFETFSAPTQSLLQKWLRELHNCFIEVGIHSPENKYFTKRNLRYFVKINYYGKNFNIEMTDDEDYLKINIKTYEEALEIGLQEALKLIK